VDAKGDIVAASAADTPARLAVGSNGETLVADSSTSTGLRYQAPKTQNAIYNSAFDVWQRGTSTGTGSGGAGSAYTADRWQSVMTGGAMTTSRQVTGDTTNLPNVQYCARVQRNSGTTSTAGVNLIQTLETTDSIRFTGQTITLSFYARAGANFSSASNALGVNLYYGTGTDQNVIYTFTGATAVINTTKTLTTTWQRFTATATVPTASTEIGYWFNYTPVGTAGANDYFEITGVQLETGSVATPFNRMSGTIQGELAACQRYFWRYAPDISTNTTFASGLAISTTRAIVPVRYPVVMRTTPSFSWSSVTGHFRVFSGGYSTSDVTSLSLNSGGTQAFELDLGVASGLTTGNVVLSGTASSSAFMNLSAEL